MTRAGSAWPAALLAVLLAAPAVVADVRPLTLYQKTARASLVVRARAASDSTRRPKMRVLEIFKGSYPHQHLYIVPFRQDYGSEKPWLRPEIFREGREYLLFLRRYDPDEEDDDFHVERPPGAGGGLDPLLFQVLNAHRGVMDVPLEGAEAISSAVQRFAGIITLRDYEVQARRLRALLGASNPYMVEAGLQQVSQYLLGTWEDVDALMALLDSARADFRAGAVKILGQVASTSSPEGETQAARRRLLDQVTARALEDSSEAVRKQAVWTLGRIGGPEVKEILLGISRGDPSQSVRYHAEVALAEMAGMLSRPRR